MGIERSGQATGCRILYRRIVDEVEAALAEIRRQGRWIVRLVRVGPSRRSWSPQLVVVTPGAPEAVAAPEVRDVGRAAGLPRLVGDGYSIEPRNVNHDRWIDLLMDRHGAAAQLFMNLPVAVPTHGLREHGLRARPCPADKKRNGEAARGERELADGSELPYVDRERCEHREHERSDRKHFRDHG